MLAIMLSADTCMVILTSYLIKYCCVIAPCSGGCQNGGTCIDINNCSCTIEWTGSNCEDKNGKKWQLDINNSC